MAVLVATFGVAYLFYWFFAITPHIADHRVLMMENKAYFGFKSIGKVLRVPYRGVIWTDPILFPLALIGAIAAFTATPA